MAKNVKVDKKTAKKIAEKKTLAGKIRELTDEQIYAKINELKQELFNLRFQAEVGKLEKTADLRKVKKEIARFPSESGFAKMSMRSQSVM